ncbi:MAG: thrombospondin type 3 repeat-containing protein [Gammaproteobacteria bacterium]
MQSLTLIAARLFAAGALALTALGVHAMDSDGDGINDNVDNCSLVANAGQQDTNGDGFGNLCDADLNNDLIVNVLDLGLLRSVFFTADADADFNSDGVVNVVDLGILRSGFFQPPGPGASVSAVTWTNDVQPIFGELCAPCHTDLGIGDLNIGTEYASATLPAFSGDCQGLTKGACTIVRIQNGQMPSGRGCSGDPAVDAGNDACLDQAEQDLVQAWIDDGIPE